jgi:hypothetical protein
VYLVQPRVECKRNFFIATIACALVSVFLIEAIEKPAGLLFSIQKDSQSIALLFLCCVFSRVWKG